MAKCENIYNLGYVPAFLGGGANDSGAAVKMC